MVFAAFDRQDSCASEFRMPPDRNECVDEIRLAPTVRVIRTRDEIEEIQEAWTAWQGARDADIDVYRTCLHSVWDRAEPYIIVIERSGQPDAILIGTKSRSSLLARIGYLRISVP